MLPTLRSLVLGFVSLVDNVRCSIIHPSLQPVEISFYGSKNEYEIDQIDIAYVKRDGVLLQELPISIEGFVGFTKYIQEFIVFEDVNFDGYLDFMVCRSAGANNHFFDYWTWDPIKEVYFSNQGFNRLEAHPALDPDAKRIVCASKDGAALHFGFVYQVENGLPVMIERKDTVYHGNGARTVTLYHRQNDSLVKSKEWTENAE